LALYLISTKKLYLKAIFMFFQKELLWFSGLAENHFSKI